MGGELKRILDGQRELEQQFNHLTFDEEGSGLQILKDRAHSVNSKAQGDVSVCVYFLLPQLCMFIPMLI